jgi:hypothetical protein
LRVDALQRAGCKRVYEATVSGARRDRPQLEAASPPCAMAIRAIVNGAVGNA